MTNVIAQPVLVSEPPANLIDERAKDVRMEIDAKTRPVILALFSTGIFWLLISSVMGMGIALKLQFPEFLNVSFLTFGRLFPAVQNVFILGWCSLVGLGIAIWVIDRLSARVAVGKGMAFLGVALWNLGLIVGFVSLLSGDLRPFVGLEFPLAANVLIYCGFFSIAIWVLFSFNVSGREVPIAAMFIFAAICWFLWSFLTGNLLLSYEKFTGSMEQIVTAWTAHGVVWLWLVPMAIGALYFVIPKVTGAPIFSGAVGRASFWIYFIIGGVAAMKSASGGPIPLWILSLSGAASMLLLVPIIATVYNLLASFPSQGHLHGSPASAFARFGLVILAVGGILLALSVLKFVDYAVHFTFFDLGIQSLVLQGFVSMVFFGCIYYIMPRLSGCEWISSTLISIHFLGSAYGAAMGAVMLLIGGIFAGVDSADAGSLFPQIMQSNAFFYWGRTISFILLLGGYLSFVLHFFLMALRIGQPEGEATLMGGARAH